MISEKWRKRLKVMLIVIVVLIVIASFISTMLTDYGDTYYLDMYTRSTRYGIK